MENNWDDKWLTEKDNDYWKTPDKDVVLFITSLSKDTHRTALDYGCGIGRHSILLAKSGYNVTAIDTSKNAINYLDNWAEKANLKVDTKVEDITSLGSIFYDIILAYNVIYHGTRDSFSNCLNNIYEKLNNNGLLFLTCPTRDDGKYGFGEKVEPHTFLCDKSIHKGDIHYFTDETDLKDLLKAFTICKIKRDEHYWDNNGEKQFSSNFKVICRKG